MATWYASIIVWRFFNVLPNPNITTSLCSRTLRKKLHVITNNELIIIVRFLSPFPFPLQKNSFWFRSLEGYRSIEMDVCVVVGLVFSLNFLFLFSTMSEGMGLPLMTSIVLHSYSDSQPELRAERYWGTTKYLVSYHFMGTLKQFFYETNIAKSLSGFSNIK